MPVQPADASCSTSSRVLSGLNAKMRMPSMFICGLALG